MLPAALPLPQANPQFSYLCPIVGIRELVV
jgi:hypothetical protein